MTELFTEEDLISTYTDAQAIEDGMIVDLPAIGCRVTFNGRPVNRMTRHLFTEMLPFLMDRDNPMSPPADEDQLAAGHIKDLASTIRTKFRYARDTAGPGEERGVFYELPPKLWLILNEETAGWTLMLPSDY